MFYTQMAWQMARDTIVLLVYGDKRLHKYSICKEKEERRQRERVSESLRASSRLALVMAYRPVSGLRPKPLSAVC